MTNVLREAYVKVGPNTDGFDVDLKEQLRRKDPGGKAGKLVGAQLNAALRRVDVETIDIKADPKQALLAIAATEDRLKALARDSATVEVKVQTEKALLELRRFKKQLGDVGDVDAGPGFMKSFTNSLGDSLASAGRFPQLVIGASILGATLAPTLAAAIGAGIAGSVGAAAILGGIALVAKDPLVTTYGKNIGQRLLAGLTAEAQVFKQPVLDALAALDAAATRSLPKIGKMFDQQAPQIRGLTDSITHAGEALLDSFVVASGRSAPAMGALGHMITAVGASVGGFIKDVTANSSAGASALNDLTDAMTSTIQTTGMFIHGLADIKGALDSFDSIIDKARFNTEDFFTKLSGGRTVFDITADGYKKGSAAAELYRKGVIGAAGSVNDYKAFQQSATASTAAFTNTMTVAAVTADDVAAAQKHLTDVQGALTVSLSSMGGAASVAGQRSAALKTAMDNLYGAAIRNTDANETYHASFDALSATVKANAGEVAHHTSNLSINTVAGRSNRDALEALLTSTNELYVADIAAGVSIAAATKKHQDRIAAVKEEAKRVHLNKAATDDLIATYGAIPRKKQTDLVLDGVKAVVQALQGLYLYQRALATGRTVGQTAHEIANEKGLPRGFQGPVRGPDGKFYAEGGWTGPGSKYQPAGVVHAGEYVFNAQATSKLGVQRLNEMHKNAQMPGYARGGVVAPVDVSRRWPFPADMSGTKVMSRAEAASKVMPAFGNWPSSPSAQRGDSGVWRSIVALIKSTGPLSGSFGNAYRPGDPLWHGSGRAVDWMGFNQDALATFLAARRPLELIHRTAKRDYAYTRGVDKGSFNNSLMEAHRNHVHIAMAGGGVVREPVLGVGASGRSYSFGERGPETVTPGTGGGGVTYVLNFSGPVASRRAAKDMVLGAIRELKSERKLP